MEWCRKRVFHLGIFSIGMLFTCNYIQAQNWPIIYGDNFNGTIDKIEETYDHGFLISAYTYTYAGWPIRDWLIKIDINGNVLWEKQFGNGMYSNGVSDSKITSDHGIILAAGTSKYSGNYDPTFIKLNVCGEIEWCKVLISPEDNYGTGIIQLFDGSYIGMLQYYGEGETYARINLVKMDQAGELVWIQRLAQEDTLIYNEEGGDLYLTSDGNFLVSGQCFHPGLKPFWIKTDTSGNQVWDLMWQGGIGGAYQVAESSNGFFYSAGGFAGPGYPMTPSIFKFNLNGFPLYRAYLLGDTIRGGEAKPITILNDTIIISGMSWGISPNVDEGFSEIMKTDTLGNIINRRILLNENRPPETIILSSDGKILICGNYVVDGNWDIYMWKMNTNLEDDTLNTQPLIYDSLCPYEIQSDTVELDCGVFVSIDEIPTREEYESTIKISPNPARDWIVFTMPDIKLPDEMELTIYNIFGQEVMKTRAVPQNRSVSLNVSGLPPGVYLVTCRDSKQRGLKGKFVVSH
jgi:hypothetical protein